MQTFPFEINAIDVTDQVESLDDIYVNLQESRRLQMFPDIESSAFVIRSSGSIDLIREMRNNSVDTKLRQQLLDTIREAIREARRKLRFDCQPRGVYKYIAMFEKVVDKWDAEFKVVIYRTKTRC